MKKKYKSLFDKHTKDILSLIDGEYLIVPGSLMCHTLILDIKGDQVYAIDDDYSYYEKVESWILSDDNFKPYTIAEVLEHELDPPQIQFIINYFVEKAILL